MEDTKQIYAKSSFVHRDFGPLVMWKWPAVRDWKAKRPGAGFCSRNLGDDDMGCKMPPQNSHAVLLACIAQRHHLISMDFHIHCCLHRSVHCCLPAASGETFDQKTLEVSVFCAPFLKLPGFTHKRYHGKIQNIWNNAPRIFVWPIFQSSSGTSNLIPEGSGGFVVKSFAQKVFQGDSAKKKLTQMLHGTGIFAYISPKSYGFSCR